MLFVDLVISQKSGQYYGSLSNSIWSNGEPQFGPKQLKPDLISEMEEYCDYKGWMVGNPVDHL